MRRADRLYRITDYLRGRRLTTADWLANRLRVSVRTVYRDIAELIAAGVPVHGEVGVGYALARRMDLPPLMFDRDELAALALGLRFVVAQADLHVRTAAERAQAKMLGMLPRELAEQMRDHKAFVPQRDPHMAARLGEILTAVSANRLIAISYVDADGHVTSRDIWPLGALFGVEAWSVIAWCELRQAHRTFRLDRISRLQPLEQQYVDVPGRRLQDFFDHMQAEHGIPTQFFDPER